MSQPEVEILMGVYRGATHLPVQLASLAQQTHSHWRLTVSDDSPDDESAGIIRAFAAQSAQPVVLKVGPKKGFSANYLQLLRQAGPGYVALADQDDHWLRKKLARGLAALPDDRPALYCARSFYWDGFGDGAGDGTWQRQAAPLYARPPGFRNALIENVAQGNTILLNPAATALVRAAAHEVGTVFAHDWWIYLLISGAGGQVICDNGPPVLLYRQHGHNQIGAGRGLAAQIRRKRAVMQGAFGQRLDSNCAALERCRAFLSDENAELLARFARARGRPWPARLAHLAGLGLYRQRRLSTLGFWGAALIGRV